MAKKMEGGFKMLVNVALTSAASSVSIAAPTKKRSNEEDQSPPPVNSSRNDLPPFEKQSRLNFSAERDFRPLPLTTQDLSLLTFLPTLSDQSFNPVLPIIPDANVSHGEPFNFNWPYVPNPPTLSPADDSLLQTFYSTGTLPIPHTPANDPSSLILTNDLLSQPSFTSTSNLSSALPNGSIDTYHTELGDYGFNFDPTIPFDWGESKFTFYSVLAFTNLHTP